MKRQLNWPDGSQPSNAALAPQHAVSKATSLLGRIRSMLEHASHDLELLFNHESKTKSGSSEGFRACCAPELSNENTERVRLLMLYQGRRSDHPSHTGTGSRTRIARPQSRGLGSGFVVCVLPFGAGAV
jgi:hypothetical protein